MAQRTGGIYGILSFPWTYDLFQKLIGSNQSRKTFVDEFIKPGNNDKILDIGCGTGVLLEYMPNVDYVGYDLNPQYILSAKETFGDRAEFHTGNIEDLKLSNEKKFDIVLAVGVMHHLDDETEKNLLKIAHSVLKKGSRLITIDPVFVENQHYFARFLINNDRGLNVRFEHEALKLYQPFFPNVKSVIRHDLLRVPYSHLIMEATRE